MTAMHTINATLSHWLRLLWDMAPPLRLDSESPYIAGGAIHLPARSHWRHHSAAAAHAAAHLVYSPVSFDGEGLGAIPRALMALLEDARVEALAVRELPGLARLWRPLHDATPDLGSGFEALMQRLARALCDPSYDDPHPWVRKGRALFYLDAGLGLLALRTPLEVRQAASRLGHDIGQMRLQFNGRAYLPLPAYRDDHRWMWTADMPEAVQPPPESAQHAEPDQAGSSDEPAPDADPDGTTTWQPEWDRLISRMRLDWCRVIEEMVPSAPPQPIDAALRRAATQLSGPLRALTRDTTPLRRSDEGDAFDLDALVDWRIGRALRLPLDVRVYRGPAPRHARASVWLLVDQSASTAATIPGETGSVWGTAARSAFATALALQSAGVACAVAGFSSQGRHAVRLRMVKSPDTPADERMLGRLASLRPGGSTRLGAALRHAAGRLAERASGRRWVVLLSDGEAHDIDVHDPRYLVEDARHAVREAGRRAVRVMCLVLAPETRDDARRIFGPRGVERLRAMSDLPRALQRLLA